MKSTGEVIVRRRVEKNFTILPNELLQNDRLSWKALGILAYTLSLPGNFRLRLSVLSKRHGSGRDATRAGLKELEQAGYLRIRWERSPLGKFTQCIWEVSDRPAEKCDDHPCSDYPDTADPITGDPASEKPTLQRTTTNKELSSKRTTTGAQGDMGPMPACLNQATLQALPKMLAGIPQDDVTRLVDELAHAVQSPGLIRTDPVRWFGGLVNRYRRGQFNPTAPARQKSLAAPKSKPSTEVARQRLKEISELLRTGMNSTRSSA